MLITAELNKVRAIEQKLLEALELSQSMQAPFPLRDTLKKALQETTEQKGELIDLLNDKN